MIALDTEATGLDLHHGCKPYFISICDDKNRQYFWQWDVDPLTRQPIIPAADIREVATDLRKRIKLREQFILQNAKFDKAALDSIGVYDWDWSLVTDTLFAGHILSSNTPHNLTDMALVYLDESILQYELDAKEASQECRRIAKERYPNWMIADEGLPCLPSVKKSANRDEDKPWKNDMWLPRAMVKHWWENDVAGLTYKELVERGIYNQTYADYLARLPGWEYRPPEMGGEHRYWKVLEIYANVDTAVTINLWRVQESIIKYRMVDKIFDYRRKIVPLAYKLEKRGVTLSKKRLEDMKARFKADSDNAGRICVYIAKQFGYDLKMPKAAAPNDSLRTFMLDVMKLEPVYAKKSKTGEPTLAKEAMEHWQATLPVGPEREFVDALMGKRSRDTALTYMAGYERFWIPTGKWNERGEQLWYRLHPFVNAVGTDTLRWSSSNPNSQNISKKKSFNLRYAFGPEPGREWWSMDGKNLELRIPAFEADETDLVWIFNHPDQGPYYGSYHLAIFDLLYPDIFAEHGVRVKDLYESTLYQWVKNGNFAIIYGAQQRTADAAYHFPGAFMRISSRFPKIAALNERQKRLANIYGFVETMPDKTVDPLRGYPIICSRSDFGDVMPTTPLNYHVSGTAMQWTCKAMVRCDEQLTVWNNDRWDGFITMQVHDELVFDCPRGRGKEPWKTNLPRIRKLQQLMEQGGVDIGVPTPVSVEYHAETWDVGLAI